MNKTKSGTTTCSPLPWNETKNQTNGGKMDLYTLLIAQSLSEPKIRASINEKRPYQAEESLPAIDFSLLADVRREQSERARRGQFVPGAAIRATA
jgi:hypothetical protein